MNELTQAHKVLVSIQDLGKECKSAREILDGIMETMAEEAA